MPLHILKLAVGCDSLNDLKQRVADRVREHRSRGEAPRHTHVTRMVPQRGADVLAGGSIYWVIRGEIAAREKIVAIEPFTDGGGINRCRLVMQPKVIAVAPRPMRPFQGWRYLKHDDAPADLGRSAAASIAAMPEPMRRELRELGLL